MSISWPRVGAAVMILIVVAVVVVVGVIFGVYVKKSRPPMKIQKILSDKYDYVISKSVTYNLLRVFIYSEYLGQSENKYFLVQNNHSEGETDLCQVRDGPF